MHLYPFGRRKVCFMCQDQDVGFSGVVCWVWGPCEDSSISAVVPYFFSFPFLQRLLFPSSTPITPKPTNLHYPIGRKLHQTTLYINRIDCFPCPPHHHSPSTRPARLVQLAGLRERCHRRSQCSNTLCQVHHSRESVFVQVDSVVQDLSTRTSASDSLSKLEKPQ